jgi:serine/threonine-protein kinase
VVQRVLGQGGMGQVLEVEHVALGRRFALKVLRLERWNDELVRRFNREARALARLSTPRVAQVTDFGIDPEVGPYYVMELLEGETLEDRLQRSGPLAPVDALRVCAEVCDALTEVHAAGLVHRDLKPSNVGLARVGPVAVKLLDFGLAASTDDAFLSRITQSQQILGSLPYMAPEQFNGAPPVPSVDVYAVGVVLYESLTGRLPYLAPSTAALIHQILATPPPPLPAELPGRTLLEPLLERLLAKEAHERFASATAAAHALREAATVLGGRRSSHPQTRVASEVDVPATQEQSRAHALGHLPTMLAEATPSPTSVSGWPPPDGVAESGARLVAPSHPFHPPTVVSSAGLSTAQATPAAWPIWLLLVGVLGVAMAGAAGVGVVVVLGRLDDARAPASVSAPARSAAPVAAPPPPPMRPPAPAATVETPAAPVPPATAEATAQVEVTAPTAPAISPPAPEEQPAAPRVAARRRPRVEDPPSPPPIFAPPPTPRTSSSGPPGGGGIIRQW